MQVATRCEVHRALVLSTYFDLHLMICLLIFVLFCLAVTPYEATQQTVLEADRALFSGILMRFMVANKVEASDDEAVLFEDFFRLVLSAVFEI